MRLANIWYCHGFPPTLRNCNPFTPNNNGTLTTKISNLTANSVAWATFIVFACVCGEVGSARMRLESLLPLGPNAEPAPMESALWRGDMSRDGLDDVFGGSGGEEVDSVADARAALLVSEGVRLRTVPPMLSAIDPRVALSLLLPDTNDRRLGFRFGVRLCSSDVGDLSAASASAAAAAAIASSGIRALPLPIESDPLKSILGR